MSALQTGMYGRTRWYLFETIQRDRELFNRFKNVLACGSVQVRTVRFDFSLLHCVATMLNGVTSNRAVFHTVELLKSE